MSVENPNPTDFTSALQQQRDALKRFQELGFPEVIQEITQSSFPTMIDYDQDQVEFGQRLIDRLSAHNAGEWVFSLGYPRSIDEHYHAQNGLFDGSLIIRSTKGVPTKRKMYYISDDTKIILTPNGFVQISGKETTFEGVLGDIDEIGRPLRKSLEIAFKRPLRVGSKIVLRSLGVAS